MSFRVLLLGGGTGGHVAPLMAVAEQLSSQAQQQGIELELQAMGDGEVLTQYAQELGIRTRLIGSPKWRRYFSLLNFFDLLKLPLAMIRSLFYVWLFMPDVIFAKGGYSSVIPAWVARLYRIPIVIHESDAIPGKANLSLAKFARKVYLAFPSASQYFPTDKTEAVGRPIQAAILAAVAIDRKAALAGFQLQPGLPTLLVTGASQGAQAINDLILSSLVQLVDRYQIIHQCGTLNYADFNKKIQALIEEGKESYGKQIEAGYRLYPFLNTAEMATAYAACDVAIARAGSQIFELGALGKPMVLIPLPTAAADHQEVNAQEFRQHGAIAIEQDNLTPHILMSQIADAYDRRDSIGIQLKQYVRTDAAAVIAQYLLQYKA